METVVEELNQIKRERQEKAARKETRANRKRLPKRDPMTPQIYKELIKEAEGPTYLNVRLRLALCLLADWCSHQRTIKYKSIRPNNIDSRILDCYRSIEPWTQ